MLTTTTPKPQGKIYLKKVRLNSGGYDSFGEYFGTGQPLYRASGETDYPSIDFEEYVRAHSREEAKEKIQSRYPKTTIIWYR